VFTLASLPVNMQPGIASRKILEVCEMKKMQTAVLALTAATGMALVGTSAAQTNPKPKVIVPPSRQQAPVPVKHRTAKLAFDPADIYVDQYGNVVIKDAQLASEVQRVKGLKGPAMDNILCGIGCSLPASKTDRE